MSKPVFKDVFKFSGRRNRLSYNLLSLAMIGILIVLAVIFTAGAGMADHDNPLGFIFVAFSVAGFVATGIAGWAGASQRVRDFGQSGAWVLVSLIPYVGIAFSLALMCIPSTEGDNQYGPSCIK